MSSMRLFRVGLALLFASLLALPAAAAPVPSSIVTPADLDQALTARRDAEAAARATIGNLLAREEVRALARDAGIDLRRAEAGVATLQGDELQQVASQAAAADTAIGGSDTIHISLIAALLIVIIIILLVK
jgi:hypothetical protein